MVSKYFWVVGLLLAVMTLAATTAFAKECHKDKMKGECPEVTLPEAATKALGEAYPKATLGKAYAKKCEGLTLYRASLKEGTSEWWVVLGGDGTIAYAKYTMDLKDLPAAASAAITKAADGKTVTWYGRKEIWSEVRTEGDVSRLVKLDAKKTEYVGRFDRGDEFCYVGVAEDGKITRDVKCWAHPRRHDLKEDVK